MELDCCIPTCTCSEGSDQGDLPVARRCSALLPCPSFLEGESGFVELGAVVNMLGNM